MATRIADVSVHQGAINFTKMKSAGLSSSIIRVAYGTYKDNRFDTNAKNGLAAKMVSGSYQFATWHYYYPGFTKAAAKSNAKAQANKAISYCKAVGLKGILALDLELEQGCTTTLSKADLTELANYVMDLYKAAGFQPMLYCSISWLYDRMIPSKVKYPLWLAYYYNTGSSAFPNTGYGNNMRSLGDKVWIWQFSSSFNGYSYGCSSSGLDMNYVYHKLPSGSSSTNESVVPKPNPAPKTVTKNLTLKVASGVWNIRKSYSMSATVLTTVKGGTQLKSTKKTGEWYYIPSKKGYIHQSGVTIVTTKSKPSGNTKKSYAKGTAIKPGKINLYASASAKSASGKLGTGTYYIYDGKVVSGRMTVTNAKSNVGKTPIGMYVTGWVNKSDIYK